MIVPHSQIVNGVTDLWNSGGFPRGKLTGWPSVDELYTVGMHQWTLVTGSPNSGKSEWLDALMVNLAKQGSWKFFIYSPENQPLELHHAKILEKYIGKPFNPGPTKRMDIEEVVSGEAWMEDKFFFCKPERPDIESIVSEAINAFMMVSHGENWNTGIVIDPWNFLEHHRPPHWSETEYVSAVLSSVIQVVRDYNIHLWLVAHPAKQTPRRDGTYAVPTPRDISGSAHFWNKADNCITVWRDQAAQSEEVEIHVQKVRFKHNGHLGIAKLMYDKVTGRYHEQKQSMRVVENKVWYDN